MQRSRHGLPRSTVVKYKKPLIPPTTILDEVPQIEEETQHRTINNSVIDRILEIEGLVEQKRKEISPE